MPIDQWIFLAVKDGESGTQIACRVSIDVGILLPLALRAGDPGGRNPNSGDRMGSCAMCQVECSF